MNHSIRTASPRSDSNLTGSTYRDICIVVSFITTLCKGTSDVRRRGLLAGLVRVAEFSSFSSVEVDTILPVP
jgi:hypothetical protein